MKSIIFILVAFCFLLTACGSAPTPVTPLASSGTVLFQDEFTDRATGWDRLSNDGGIMDYDAGGYRMLVKKPGLNFWSTPGKDFRDVRIEADVKKLNGPDENRMGLMCRYKSGNYYFFIISNDGYYAIGKFISGQTTLLGQEQMVSSTFIQPNVINHLRADCVGNVLTLYVNNNLVAGAKDADLQSGDIGVLAGAFTQPGVDVLFNHFVVTQP